MTKVTYPHPYLPESEDEKRAGSFAHRVQKNFEAISSHELGGGEAIVTIAASNTAAKKRKFADYKCDGTDDQDTLAQAFADGYSHFLLLPGDFYFSDEFNGTDDPTLMRSYTVQGLGRSTVVHGTGALKTVFYNQSTGEHGTAHYRDMTISIEGHGGFGIYDFGDHYDVTTIANIRFVTPDDAPETRKGIYLANGPARMTNIVFGNFCGLYGIVMAGFTGSVADGVYADRGNDAAGGVFHGDALINVDGADRCAVLNSRLVGNECTTAAVYWTGAEGLLSGCVVTDTTGPADVDASGVTDLREAANLIGVEL